MLPIWLTTNFFPEETNILYPLDVADWTLEVYWFETENIATVEFSRCAGEKAGEIYHCAWSWYKKPQDQQHVPCRHLYQVSQSMLYYNLCYKYARVSFLFKCSGLPGQHKPKRTQQNVLGSKGSLSDIDNITHQVVYTASNIRPTCLNWSLLTDMEILWRHCKK